MLVLAAAVEAAVLGLAAGGGAWNSRYRAWERAAPLGVAWPGRTGAVCAKPR